MQVDWEDIGKFLLISLVFFPVFILLNLIAASFQLETTITPWYLPAGLFLTFPLVFGSIYGLTVFVVLSLSAVFYFNLVIMEGLILALTVSIGYTIIGVSIRSSFFPIREKQLIDKKLIRRLPLILLIPLLIAIINALIVPSGAHLPFYLRVIIFWLGDLLGIVTIGPLVIFLYIYYKDSKQLDLPFFTFLKKIVSELTKEEIFSEFIILMSLVVTNLLIVSGQLLGVNVFFLIILPFIINAITSSETRFILNLGIMNLFVFIVLSLEIFDLLPFEFVEFQIEIISSNILGLLVFYTYQSMILEKTAKEEATLQLANNQRFEALGRMSGGIAHDFNNLMHVIKSNVELIQLTEHLTDDIRENIEVIDQALEKGSSLISEILNYGRSQELQLRMTDLNKLILTSEVLIDGLIGEAQSVKYSLNPIPMLQLDADKISHVLINLVTNARDAISDDGRIQIRTDFTTMKYVQSGIMNPIPPGKYVRVIVSDNGSGISEEIQDKIFDPFFTTKKMGEGTGLGLSSILGIVQNHQGHIQLRTGEGGSDFMIYFPIVLATIEDISETSDTMTLDSSLPLKNNLRIIVVDDNDDIINSLRSYFQDSKSKFYYFNHPEECLNSIRTKKLKVDIIISDVVMPRMDGIELVEKILDLYTTFLYKHPGIIYITGYSDRLLPTNITYNYKIISKPFSLNQLVTSINNLAEI